MTERRCPGCGESKPLDRFSPDPWHSQGLHPYCRACVRRRQQTLGRVTSEERLRMWNRQHRACGVCREPVSDPYALHIDHDWDTNWVRGLLHRRCNCLLGDAGDSTELLGNAIYYLGHHNGRHSLALPQLSLFADVGEC